jgi:hypothetical protein
MPAPGTRRVICALVACEFIPVPLVDTVVQNEIRRTWIRWLSAREGVSFPADLADQPLLPLKRAALWPLRLLAEKVFPPFALWGMWTVARDAWLLGRRLSEPRSMPLPAREAPGA